MCHFKAWPKLFLNDGNFTSGLWEIMAASEIYTKKFRQRTAYFYKTHNKSLLFTQVAFIYISKHLLKHISPRRDNLEQFPNCFRYGLFTIVLV